MYKHKYIFLAYYWWMAVIKCALHSVKPMYEIYFISLFVHTALTNISKIIIIQIK